MNHVRTLKKIVSNIEKVIVGKRGVIELVLTAFVCKGHVLLEDVPGVGKTSLAGALAKSVDCTFKRVQFTPDIMPSDITGFSAYNPKTGEFEFKKGVILSQIVLADEINRTSPKTQSSLLEAMEERQVTVDGNTHKIDEPFIVLATQNPIEYVGTYPLPEAQMDRFIMKLSLGYPDKTEEMKLINRHKEQTPLNTITPVASRNDIIELQEAAQSVHLSFKVNEYIVDLTRHTRQDEYALLGASPRASLALCRAAQAWALFHGRDYVEPDDCIDLAHAVLSHRIILKPEAHIKKVSRDDIITRALENTPVPQI